MTRESKIRKSILGFLLLLSLPIKIGVIILLTIKHSIFAVPLWLFGKNLEEILARYLFVVLSVWRMGEIRCTKE
jgi:hypothetical protein